MIRASLTKGPVYSTLYDQYSALNLPTHLMGADRDFTIFDLNDLKRNFPFESPVSRLNFFVFVFVKDGSGSYIVDDVKYAVEPGIVYFTNPGHWRSFKWLHANNVCLITLSESFLKENVHGDIFDEFPFLLAETFPGKKISETCFCELEIVCNQIRSAYAGSSLYRRRKIGSLFAVILLKIKELFWLDYDARSEGDRTSAIVRDFKLLLEEHYRDVASGHTKRLYQIQDYAAKLQLHPNYLNSVIKIKTGRPVSHWIAEKNITDAKYMLIHTHSAVKVIAYRLGFIRPAHFSSYFKKHTGYCPLEYRTHCKNNPDFSPLIYTELEA